MSKAPPGYKCPNCRTENKFPPYVYAHWDIRLTHACDCGAKNDLFQGRVISTELPPRPRRIIRQVKIT